MPFLGQDWRSPGGSWVKTGSGWKRGSHDKVNDIIKFMSQENKENSGQEQDFEVVVKKRRKDMLNNTAKTQYFHKDKWIYVHKGSTKERHGYCTLGEAFNRLDFSAAIHDRRRFTYVVRLLQLIAQSQLTSLSGAAQKNYFNILEKIVNKVLNDQENIRLIKELLQGLHTSLCQLVEGVGKSVLVGNINLWYLRMESILQWHYQLKHIQITAREDEGLTLVDLPADMQLNILRRLADGRDILSVGRVSARLSGLCEDRLLWKRLCQYHFTERQFRRRLMLNDKGQIDWQRMYFKMQRCYPRKEEYGDTPQFCRHCHVLFWKDTGHPCTANNPECAYIPLSPQAFINLFKF